MRIGRFGELGGGYVAKPLKKCLTITGHPLFKSEFLGVLYSRVSFILSRKFSNFSVQFYLTRTVPMPVLQATFPENNRFWSCLPDLLHILKFTGM